MSQRTVSRRYASALCEEAERAGTLDAVDEDVEMLRRSLETNDELSRFFKSPVIPSEKKRDVIDALLEDRVEPLTLRFLHLLVEKDRETSTAAILNAYHDLRDEQRGIVDATARVAHPLSEDDREALIDALEAHTDKTIRLHVEEEPDLIGGIVIRIGDHVFDGSIRNRLSALHDRLRESTVVSGNGAAA
jgi:F-type H+-transporting ATPase subunit delta